MLIQSCVLVNSKDRSENYRCDKTVLITLQSCSQLSAPTSSEHMVQQS